MNNRKLFRSFGRHYRGGLKGRLFVLMLILAGLLLVYFIRRNNILKAGIQPRPFLEDLRYLYGQMISRLQNGDISGMIDELLGKNPVAY
jgi:hypothetical protein